WDPKPDAPSNVRGEFKPIKSNVPGVWLSEVMPLMAKQMDKATLIRSVSYTPAGLFNHTAAIYQLMTGYTPDRVSPSGQLEPPPANDFPHFGFQAPPLNPRKRRCFRLCFFRGRCRKATSSAKAARPGSLARRTIPISFTRIPTRIL